MWVSIDIRGTQHSRGGGSFQRGVAVVRWQLRLAKGMLDRPNPQESPKLESVYMEAKEVDGRSRIGSWWPEPERTTA